MELKDILIYLKSISNNINKNKIKIIKILNMKIKQLCNGLSILNIVENSQSEMITITNVRHKFKYKEYTYKMFCF